MRVKNICSLTTWICSCNHRFLSHFEKWYKNFFPFPTPFPGEPLRDTRDKDLLHFFSSLSKQTSKSNKNNLWSWLQPISRHKETCFLTDISLSPLSWLTLTIPAPGSLRNKFQLTPGPWFLLTVNGLADNISALSWCLWAMPVNCLTHSHRLGIHVLYIPDF